MRAKLDESMPNDAAEALRAAGWECDTVHDEGLSGAEDIRVASVCRAEARVLFTLDPLQTFERTRRPTTRASSYFVQTDQVVTQ